MTRLLALVQPMTGNLETHFGHKCTRLLFDKVQRSASTRPASRPQQRACAHVYADAVLPVQYIGSPRPVVD